MPWGYVFFSFLILSVSSQASLLTDASIGKSYKYVGPNCFGAALYGAGVYDLIRGVDNTEFEHVLKTSCSEVSEPQEGDVGVYGVSNFGAVHAFTYISEELAFEKQGADYAGKTPVQVIRLSDLKYRSEATTYCRQFGDESCFNKLTYYRCGEFKKPRELIVFEETLSAILEERESEWTEYELLSGFFDLKRKSEIHPSIINSLKEQLHFILGYEVEDTLWPLGS